MKKMMIKLSKLQKTRIKAHTHIITNNKGEKMELALVGMQEELRAIERAVHLDIPVLIVGPTGCGKTTMLKEVAKAKDKTLIRISLNGEVGITELVGKWLLVDKKTVWQDGVLVDAMRHGHWVVLDEINAALPEVLFCLNSVLDDARALTIAEKDGEVVHAHPDFRAFATMNPSGEYVGTKELNMALLSRFGIKLESTYQKPSEELKIIEQTTLNKDMSKIVVDIGKFLRKMHKDRVVSHIVSTRDLLVMARLLKDGAKMQEALSWSVLNKLEELERKDVFETLQKGLKLDINWDANAETVLKNLTEDLVLSVEALNAKKARLEVLVKTLQEGLDLVLKDTSAV